MFSLFRQEILPVEVYGKLPIAKDYLRVGCSEGAGQAWRGWLDAGYSGSAAGSFPTLAAPLRFTTGSVWGEPLVGLLWPSSDAGGLRKFPLTFLVERRLKPARADAAAGFPTARALWRELAALKRSAETRPDGAAFLAAVRGRELDVETLAPAHGERFDFTSWKVAIDGASSGLASLLARLEELRRGGPRPLLRLPLVSNLDPLEQAHAWCHLCAELGLLHGAELPALLFPADESDAGTAAFVVLATRPFQPADVEWLAPPTGTTGRAGDLCDGTPRHAPLVRESSLPLATSLLGAYHAQFGRRG